MNIAQKYIVKGTIWSVQTLAKKSNTTIWHPPTTPGNPGSLLGKSTGTKTVAGSGSTGNPAGKYGSGSAVGSTSFQATNPAKKYTVVGTTLGTGSNPAQKYGAGGSTGSSPTSTSGPSWQVRNPAQKYQTGATTTPPAGGSKSSPSWQVTNPAQKYGTGGTTGGTSSGSGSSWQTANPAQKYDTNGNSSSGSSGSWQAANPAQKFDVPSNNYGPNQDTQPVHPGVSKCNGHYYPKDIDGHWSEIYVRRLYDLCVLEGYGDGSFRPDQSITRAELTKMALYAHGILPNSGCYDADCGTPFNDLDSWQGPWIKPAWDKQIVQGYGYNQFRPNQSITRAESVKVVLATFGYEPYTVDKSFFNDVNGWATGWVEKAHQIGVVQGIGNGNFDPDRPVTRAEAAKIIVKTIEYWDTHIN